MRWKEKKFITSTGSAATETSSGTFGESFDAASWLYAGDKGASFHPSLEEKLSW